mgnify:CR=1 FL=1
MYRGRKKMNPILPLAYATPDVEAHVWPQDPNRVYLYCSNDRIDGVECRPVSIAFLPRIWYAGLIMELLLMPVRQFHGCL